jgi:hypothetical protein
MILVNFKTKSMVSMKMLKLSKPFPYFWVGNKMWSLTQNRLYFFFPFLSEIAF